MYPHPIKKHRMLTKIRYTTDRKLPSVSHRIQHSFPIRMHINVLKRSRNAWKFLRYSHCSLLDFRNKRKKLPIGKRVPPRRMGPRVRAVGWESFLYKQKSPLAGWTQGCGKVLDLDPSLGRGGTYWDGSAREGPRPTN